MKFTFKHWDRVIAELQGKRDELLRKNPMTSIAHIQILIEGLQQEWQDNREPQ